MDEDFQRSLQRTLDKEMQELKVKGNYSTWQSLAQERVAMFARIDDRGPITNHEVYALRKFTGMPVIEL